MNDPDQIPRTQESEQAERSPERLSASSGSASLSAREFILAAGLGDSENAELERYTSELRKLGWLDEEPIFPKFSTLLAGRECKEQARRMDKTEALGSLFEHLYVQWQSLGCPEVEWPESSCLSNEQSNHQCSLDSSPCDVAPNVKDDLVRKFSFSERISPDGLCTLEDMNESFELGSGQKVSYNDALLMAREYLGERRQKQKVKQSWPPETPPYPVLGGLKWQILSFPCAEGQSRNRNLDFFPKGNKEWTPLYKEWTDHLRKNPHLDGVELSEFGAGGAYLEYVDGIGKPKDQAEPPNPKE